MKAAILLVALLPGLAGGCGTLVQHLASYGQPGLYSTAKALEIVSERLPV